MGTLHSTLIHVGLNRICSLIMKDTNIGSDVTNRFEYTSVDVSQIPVDVLSGLAHQGYMAKWTCCWFSVRFPLLVIM